MSEKSIENEVNRQFLAFEKLETLHTNEAWEQLLVNKLHYTKPRTPSRISPFYMAVILFILLVNIGFLINVMNHNTTASSSHEQDLHLISKELLINPQNQ